MGKSRYDVSLRRRLWLGFGRTGDAHRGRELDLGPELIRVGGGAAVHGKEGRRPILLEDFYAEEFGPEVGLRRRARQVLLREVEAVEVPDVFMGF